MAIAVMFDDHKVDYAPKTYFDLLLNTGCIIAFKRSNGEWVDVSTGPVRGRGTDTAYRGPERREQIRLFGNLKTGWESASTGLNR